MVTSNTEVAETARLTFREILDLAIGGKSRHPNAGVRGKVCARSYRRLMSCRGRVAVSFPTETGGLLDLEVISG